METKTFTVDNYLYQEFETMRHRPALWLGSMNLTALRNYANGFAGGIDKFVKYRFDELFPLPFWFFHEFVARHYGWYESTAGWCNIILKEMQHAEEKGLLIFYELFDVFKALSIQSCFVAALSPENIKYHYTNKYGTPKRALPPDYKKTEPLYIEPIEVFMIELTNDAGFLCMVNTDTQHRLERRIYKDKNEIATYIERCFGLPLAWEQIEISNIKFSKEFKY